MKICRFDHGRLGVVQGDEVLDATGFLQTLPAHHWGFPLEDPVIGELPALAAYLETEPRLSRLRLAEVSFDAPVPRPSKIIGAPVNYHAHLREARDDQGLHHGQTIHPIDEIGLFLKAGSALVGPAQGIGLCQPERRTDHEGEVAVVIGATGRDIPAAQALAHVAGYTLGLDMTVRGKEDRSMRKSPDSYAVLGPWLTTADEVGDPSAIEFRLNVNGEQRQAASTALLIRSIPELIEMASRFYTLYPGDVILTGTPSGVAPVRAGDVIEVSSPALGAFSIPVG